MALASKKYQVSGLIEAIEFYYQKGWTDGLPVVPPTEERVMEFLQVARKQPGDVLGYVAERDKKLTAEKVAVNAIMAGCLPEYFPVVIAAVEAICEPEFNIHGNSVSTGGSASLLIVNGPVRQKLGFNWGVNLLGPGFRPNATVGRSIRLITINLLGSVPGILDKSTFGHGGKYSYCIAEDEDAGPWAPLHVDKGFRKDESTVTAIACRASVQVMNHDANTPEGILDTVAEVMKATACRVDEYVVILGPEHMTYVRQWPKERVKQHLWEQSKKTVRDAVLQGWGRHRVGGRSDDELVPVVETPDALTVITGGGAAGGFSTCIPPWGILGTTKAITKKILI